MYRPQDEHDRIIDLENKLNRFRNSNITFRNNGTAMGSQAFGVGSKTSSISNLFGPWAINPTTQYIGSFDINGVFQTGVADSGGRWHIQLQGTGAIIANDPAKTRQSPIILHYIDGSRNNGQFIILRCEQGNTLTLKAAGASDTSQGNIKLDNDITIDDHHVVILQFFSDIGTGGGKYVVLNGMGGGATGFANTALSNLINPTAINQNLVFGNGTNFAQAKQIINVDTITFKSTSAFLPYIVGNGSNNVFNIGAHGTDIATLSNAFNVSPFIPDTGILQVYGLGHTTYNGTLWVPAIKTVNTTSVVSNGDYIGALYMDGQIQPSVTQQTFGAILTRLSSNSNPYNGTLSFQVISPNGIGLNEIMNMSNNGIGVNADIIPAGFDSINAGNANFPFKNVYGGSLKYLSNVISMAGNDITYTVSGNFSHRFYINTNQIFGVEYDNTYNDIGYVDFYQNIYLNATGGGAQTIPLQPVGYLIIKVNGVRRKIPYWAI